MNILQRTAPFDAWLSGLKDIAGKARVMQRLDSLQRGNFGDCEPVGGGVSELKIHAGQVTGFISPGAARSFTCCCLAATNLPRKKTLSVPKRC